MVPAGQLDKWVEPKKKEDSFEYSCHLGRVCVFYSLTLRLFEKVQRVKDILVPPKCLLLFQKK